MAAPTSEVESGAVLNRFAGNLRQERLMAGLSQETLAELAGIHRTEVSLLEREKREPRMATLIALAGALDVSVGVLVKGIKWDGGTMTLKTGRS